MANSTKMIIAESLKTLMKDNPLGRISVCDIAAGCGLNRQSFYYHFSDKYRLVNWIFDRDVLDRVSEYLSYESWDKALELVFTLVEKDSSFYLNALHDNFSYFYLHLVDTQRNILESFIEDLLGNRDLNREDRDFFIDFYTNAFVGSFVSWINNSMHEPGEKVVYRIKRIIRGSLKDSLEEFIK